MTTTPDQGLEEEIGSGVEPKRQIVIIGGFLQQTIVANAIAVLTCLIRRRDHRLLNRLLPHSALKVRSQPSPNQRPRSRRDRRCRLWESWWFRRSMGDPQMSSKVELRPACRIGGTVSRSRGMGIPKMSRLGHDMAETLRRTPTRTPASRSSQRRLAPFRCRRGLQRPGHSGELSANQSIPLHAANTQ